MSYAPPPLLAPRLTTQRDAEARLEQQRAQSNVRTWIDKTTGMYHTHTELDPERGAKLAAALQSIPDLGILGNSARLLRQKEG